MRLHHLLSKQCMRPVLAPLLRYSGQHPAQWLASPGSASCPSRKSIESFHVGAQRSQRHQTSLSRYSSQPWKFFWRHVLITRVMSCTRIIFRGLRNSVCPCSGRNNENMAEIAQSQCFGATDLAVPSSAHQVFLCLPPLRHRFRRSILVSLKRCVIMRRITIQGPSNCTAKPSHSTHSRPPGCDACLMSMPCHKD